MKRSPGLLSLWSVSMMIMVFASCDPGIDKRKEMVREVPVTIAKDNENCAANEYLPVLWVELSELLKANGPIAFRFQIDDWKDLTLHGWTPPYNKKPPFIKLKTSVQSNVNAGSGNYLGNLFLTAQMMAQIRQQAGTGNYTSIKFYPAIDQRSGSEGQVTYKYELTSDIVRLKASIPADSMTFYRVTTNFMLTDTTMFTADYLNPSPPRNELQ